MQCVAVCCNILLCIAVCCDVLQRVVVCCSVLQCVAVYVAVYCRVMQCVADPHAHTILALRNYTLQHIATHFNILQHTATHCNTLQHTATHCNTLHHPTTHYNTLQHTATHAYTQIRLLEEFFCSHRNIVEKYGGKLICMNCLGGILPEDCWGEWYICAMTHLRVTWLICDMTHVWHDSCVTWLIPHAWHDFLRIAAVRVICVPWLIHMWHDSRVTWLKCDMTYSTCVTWLSEDCCGACDMCAMTHSYVT